MASQGEAAPKVGETSNDDVGLETRLALCRIQSGEGGSMRVTLVERGVMESYAKTACIAPGSPWKNGFVESVNAPSRDEPLDGEIFYSFAEAEVMIESWRPRCNPVRPH